MREKVAGWRDYAACADEDPELFFPVAERGKAPSAQTAAAKAVCARCPVATECFRWAMDTVQEHGIWGQTSPNDRRELRRQRRRATFGASGQRATVSA